MKKLSFFRVRAMLCLYILRFLPPAYRRKRREAWLLRSALDYFFTRQSPEHFQYFALLAGQCWRLQDPRYKSGPTDTEFTEFLNQTAGLIRAAYRYHRYARCTIRISPGPLIPGDVSAKIL